MWEPALVKLNALTAATEAAMMILSIDHTVKSESKIGGDGPLPGMGRGRGRGRR